MGEEARRALARPADGRRCSTLLVPVREADTVLARGLHVHYSVYLCYLERAAEAHLQQLGLAVEEMLAVYRGGFVVRDLAVEYVRAARAGDVLEASTWLESVGPASLWRATLLTGQPNGAAVLTARTRHVWVGEAQRAQRMPGPVRAALQAALPGAVSP